MNENITYYLDEMCPNENEDNKESLDFLNMMQDFDSEFSEVMKRSGITEQIQNNVEDDAIFSEIKNYELNYTIKQLMLIYEYYGLPKIPRILKQDVITSIMMFEKNVENGETVHRRKRLWSCLNELKNDKMLKRFVLW